MKGSKIVRQRFSLPFIAALNIIIYIILAILEAFNERDGERK